jgi:hypothetical protein
MDLPSMTQKLTGKHSVRPNYANLDCRRSRCEDDVQSWQLHSECSLRSAGQYECRDPHLHRTCGIARPRLLVQPNENQGQQTAGFHDLLCLGWDCSDGSARQVGLRGELAGHKICRPDVKDQVPETGG